MNAEVLAVSADAMRVYIRLLRTELGYTQESFAKAIGSPYPTYRDYESGETRDLKASPFARAVDILNIPLDHIKKLGKVGVGVEEATELANKRLQVRAEIIASEVTPETKTNALEIVRQLREDPDALRELWKSFVDAGFDTEQH